MFPLQKEVKKNTTKEIQKLFESTEYGKFESCVVQKNKINELPYYLFFDKNIVICAIKEKQSEGIVAIPRNPELLKIENIGSMENIDSYRKKLLFSGNAQLNNCFCLKHIEKIEDIINIDNFETNETYQNYLLNEKQNGEINKIGSFDFGEAISSNLNVLPLKLANKLINIGKNPLYTNFIKIDNENFIAHTTIMNNLLNFKKIGYIPPMCMWTTHNIYLISFFDDEYWAIKFPRYPVEKKNNDINYIYVN
jgi:hypothetical protein